MIEYPGQTMLNVADRLGMNRRLAGLSLGNWRFLRVWGSRSTVRKESSGGGVRSFAMGNQRQVHMDSLFDIL